MRQPIPFVYANNESRSKTVNNQTLINLYPELVSQGGKQMVALYPTHGLNKLFAAGVGPCRGNGKKFSNNGYFVSGRELIKIDNNNVTTSIGNLNTSGGRVSMASNYSYLMITDGVNGYTYDGTTFAQIADADFPTADYVAILDQRFIVNDSANVGRFYISDSNDPTSWQALNFATAEANPDDMYVPWASHKDLWLFGEDTTEIYFNSGNLDFPFEPYRNSTIEFGIQAVDSVAEGINSVMWLGRSEEGANLVLQSQGGTPLIISDRDMEAELDTYTTTADAQGFTYQKGGHTVYQLTFPAAGKTWCYDLSQGVWFKKQGYLLGRHRASGHLFYNKQHIIGDYENGNFYKFDPDKYTDNGTTVERIARTQYIHKNREPVEISRLELEFEPGVGLTSGQGSDPLVSMRYSKNSGKTWSSEIFGTMGKKGEYLDRAVWNKLGTAEQWTFEFRITDPVFTALTGLYADIG